MHSNGIIEYIGRSDFQVKLNGYRIEIGEIQANILKFEGIKDAFVTILKNNNGKSLCAYIVGDVDVEELKIYLLKQLPIYMVPKYFITVDNIPLTINGKVDKKLLPEPNTENTSTFVSPSNEIEKSIYDIFCELLQTENISVIDNLFNYYIDSLTIIKAQTRLYGLGYNVSTQDFYENPTIRKLADYLSNTSKINHVNSATMPNIIDCQKEIKFNSKMENVLLIGGTGFLGIHILHDLLKKKDIKIYCLVREKYHTSGIKRLNQKFKFYFKEDDLNNYEGRIIPVNGNITENLLGIQDEIYKELGQTIDTVIHTAAIVKHYGDYNKFYNINVIGTSNIVEFCKKFNIPLNYISTMSVSGYGFCNNIDYTFTENDFYFGQDYSENVYVRSKFEAEKLIIENCGSSNLIASIFRIGNITNRYSDGEFQENSDENAFLNRISSIANLKLIPKDVLEYPVECTPVDYCSKFIVKLLDYKPNNLNVFHLFNNNYTSFKDIITTFNNFNINIKPCSLKEFKEALADSDSSNFGITNYINNLSSSKNIIITNSITNRILDSENLHWPKIDNTYISKLVSYLQKNDFI